MIQENTQRNLGCDKGNKKKERMLKKKKTGRKEKRQRQGHKEGL